jgi:phenylalanyl-tRNA synthetase beta chain
MGYLEMIFPYLGSGATSSRSSARCRSGSRGNGPDQRPVKLANPMSESYEYVRNSSLPFLLGAESVSAHAAYPHRIFEVGKIARFDAADNHGVRTVDALCFVAADAEAGFTSISGDLSVLFYYLSREYRRSRSPTTPASSRGAPRRSTSAIVRSSASFGELHPQVLENFGITVPVTCCDLDLNAILAG